MTWSLSITAPVRQKISGSPDRTCDLYNCHSINDPWKKEVSLELLKKPKREQLIYQDLLFHKLYYQPEGIPLGPGYYQTAEKMRDACKKIGYKFTLAEVKDWINKQAIYQIYKPPLKIIA
ncbi:hypothetical protein C1646_754412 [Rhizophagus diaphanus]|nr:hypothetical protein C1646_754412 [Rhizophagus diaphanus] [Rhizophagus sp. MUCL 43196]